MMPFARMGRSTGAVSHTTKPSAKRTETKSKSLENKRFHVETSEDNPPTSADFTCDDFEAAEIDAASGPTMTELDRRIPPMESFACHSTNINEYHTTIVVTSCGTTT
mmetsp:Transcript_82595/g.96588  ORF Transcript_82595/g.96588 Transcript_82595/m.96588 type:complete len:107 (+) Transcript_82595:206-526(+)